MRTCTLLLFAAACAAGQTLYVDDDAPPSGDGSATHPFQTIGEALAVTNTLSGRPTVQVAPGDYYVASMLHIIRPVILRGSTVLRTAAGGLPSGTPLNGTATRILGTAGLTTEPGSPILRADSPGQVINGVEIRDLMFVGLVNIGGLLEAHRVQDLVIRGNLFSGTASTPGISTFASSGEIRGNYFTGLLAGALLGAGYNSAPAAMEFRGNRVTQNTNGLLLVGTSDGIAEPGDQLTAQVRDNDLSENSGVGIRVLVEGNERLLGLDANAGFVGRVEAEIRDNDIKSNGTGIAVDAGFPYRVTRVAGVCDTRPFTGLVDLTLRDNSVASNTNPPVLTFTRLQALTSATARAQFKYLQSASYQISDSEGVFSAAVKDNPSTDPYTGSVCPVGSTLLNNSLTINGISY